VVIRANLSAIVAPDIIAQCLDEGFKEQLNEQDGKPRDDLAREFETAYTNKRRSIRKLAREIGEVIDQSTSLELNRFLLSLNSFVV
jgi:hypothetical protein